ncbi:hypothetical protein ANANG_G00281830 [Anguilla anguilla]|uniref:Uncharacterized protein n=1 Tax=Anguilla anguilla TaxID=7936 RepID=A0A9D3LPG3_ANGAN|nr:hypothetical protein ANANG_G00281830 [Anguilla anguilla]
MQMFRTACSVRMSQGLSKWHFRMLAQQPQQPMKIAGRAAVGISQRCFYIMRRRKWIVPRSDFLLSLASSAPASTEFWIE